MKNLNIILFAICLCLILLIFYNAYCGCPSHEFFNRTINQRKAPRSSNSTTYNNSNFGITSNVEESSKAGNNIAPPAPQQYPITNINTDSFTVLWTVPNVGSIDTITYYDIVQRLGGNKNSWISIGKADKNAESYMVTGALPDEEYDIAIYAVSGTGSTAIRSPPSNIQTVTTLPLSRPRLQTPTAPVQLPATLINDTSFVVQWKENTGIPLEFCEVYIRLEGDSTLTLVSRVRGVVTHDTIYNLRPDTTYVTTVIAYASEGIASPPSNEIYTRTLKKSMPKMAIPAPPTDLTVAPVSSNSYFAKWKPGVGGTTPVKYIIEDIGGAWGSTTSNETNAIISGIQSNRIYAIRVIAVDNNGSESYPSDVESVQIPAELKPPRKPPTLISIKARSPTSYTVAWNPSPPEDKVTEYFISQQVNAGGFITIAHVPSTVTEYTVTDLTPGNFYDVRIHAHNSAGNSIPSELLSILMQNPPTKVQDVKVVQSSPTQYTVSWKLNPPQDQVNYYLTYDQVDGSGGFRQMANTGRPDINAVTIDAFRGSEFDVYVIAVNFAGSSPPSDIASVVLINRPSAPQNVKIISVNHNGYTLQWSPNPTNEHVLRYTVMQQSDPSSPWTISGVLKINSNNGDKISNNGSKIPYTLTINTPLQKGTVYNVQLLATNMSGDSQVSDTVYVQY